MYETNTQRPRDKLLRVLVPPLKSLACLTAAAHLRGPLVSRLLLMLPTAPRPSCVPLATPTHFNVQTKPEFTDRHESTNYMEGTGPGSWGNMEKPGLMGR